MALVLEDLGEREQAGRLAAVAADYRRTILAAIDKATVRTVDPPFVPIALDGEEPVPDPITGTRLGSYWNLVVQSLLGSGVFRHDSPTATDILRYLQANGGLCMGLVRVQSARPFWVNTQNIDDLYGVRYALLLQQRDEPDRALVSFYGKLAQGMTRDTFIDGESSGIAPPGPPRPADCPAPEHRRQRQLPPAAPRPARAGLGHGRRRPGRDPAAALRHAAPLAPRRRPDHGRTRPDRLRRHLASPPIRNRGPAASRPSSTCPRARHRPGPSSACACPTALRITSARADGRPVPMADPETLDLSGLSGRVQVEATSAVRRPDHDRRSHDEERIFIGRIQPYTCRIPPFPFARSGCRPESYLESSYVPSLPPSSTLC